MNQAPCSFSFLDGLNADAGVVAGFVGRVPGVSVDTDREATLDRLELAHREALAQMGFEWSSLQRAEQVHGAELAVVGASAGGEVWPGVDGLITADPGCVLGIYVADCGAVYISDAKRGVLALLHSGKKGTEQNITGRAIACMKERFGSRAEDLCVALAPCIRPPAYEVDFAAEIREQVLSAGVPADAYRDAGVCTSSDLEAYYSYRIEKGATGRMLALLGRV